MITDNGINILTSFIIGFPGETVTSARHTIELAQELHERFRFHTLQFNTFGPFPGTDLEQELTAHGGRLLPIDGSFYPVVPAVETLQFPKDEHYRM